MKANKICECGCGQSVNKKGDRFLPLHHLKEIHNRRRQLNKILNTQCDYCEVWFHESPSRKKRPLKHSFCSRECYGMWRSENIRKEKHPSWKGGYRTYYGPNWKSQRLKALERDNYSCLYPGCQRTKETEGINMHVHHMIPFKIFGLKRYIEANDLSNLISFCSEHHVKMEEVEKKYALL